MHRRTNPCQRTTVPHFLPEGGVAVFREARASHLPAHVRAASFLVSVPWRLTTSDWQKREASADNE